MDLIIEKIVYYYKNAKRDIFYMSAFIKLKNVSISNPILLDTTLLVKNINDNILCQYYDFELSHKGIDFHVIFDFKHFTSSVIINLLLYIDKIQESNIKLDLHNIKYVNFKDICGVLSQIAHKTEITLYGKYIVEPIIVTSFELLRNFITKVEFTYKTDKIKQKFKPYTPQISNKYDIDVLDECGNIDEFETNAVILEINCEIDNDDLYKCLIYNRSVEVLIFNNFTPKLKYFDFIRNSEQLISQIKFINIQELELNLDNVDNYYFVWYKFIYHTENTIDNYFRISQFSHININAITIETHTQFYLLMDFLDLIIYYQCDYIHDDKLFNINHENKYIDDMECYICKGKRNTIKIPSGCIYHKSCLSKFLDKN